ncbi:MAG: hypothetical protein A2506_13130, partial [Elusimicrobia bacterium RIFOXYD12_FULL_66_9]
AHVPLARELHALLYLGALLILAGAAATVKDRLDQIGPLTILATLTLSFSACFAYCFRLAHPFELSKVESPTAAFDYLLYLACGLVGVFFSYLEWKWKLLGNWWDMYLFASGLLCVALAYRFDNRLVLATGLLNLAGWLGMRMRSWDMLVAAAKPALIAYGCVLLALGLASRRGQVKPHFEDSYTRFGVHLVLMTLLIDSRHFVSPQLWLLLLACGALGAWSLKERRFETFAFAVGYAYVASISTFLTEIGWHDANFSLWSIISSSGVVIALLLWARVRFKEAA